MRGGNEVELGEFGKDITEKTLWRKSERDGNIKRRMVGKEEKMWIRGRGGRVAGRWGGVRKTKRTLEEKDSRKYSTRKHKKSTSFLSTVSIHLLVLLRFPLSCQLFLLFLLLLFLSPLPPFLSVD